MDRHQAVWDARYARLQQGAYSWRGEPWLVDWFHLVPKIGRRRALDLGCGPGDNTRLLLDHGFEVTALDISERALELCRDKAAEARIIWADVREGLPFAPECFELIVADLSLHYFPWDMTASVLRDVASRLVRGGVFAGRFNSTGDTHYDAGSGEPVAGEANLFLVDGAEKRFFTRACLDRLFGPPWSVKALAEKTTGRFGSPKVVWEMVATRA